MNPKILVITGNETIIPDIKMHEKILLISRVATIKHAEIAIKNIAKNPL